MDRRRFLISSGGALGSIVIIACGGGGNGGNGEGAAQPVSTGGVPAEAKGRTRVVFWSAFSGTNGKALETLVKKFNDSQKEIFIENQYQGTYEETAQKLATALVAKQIPDMAIMSEVTWNKFYLGENLQSMSDYFKDGGLDPADYVQSLIQEGTKDNQIWWVPFARSTPLFYYNRDMFKQAGLPDRGPKTWDELREWGPALMKLPKNPKVHAYTNAANYNAWHFQGNVWQWGGNYSDKDFNILLDQGGAVEAGEWLRKFVHEDKMGYMADDQSVDFGNGLVATTQQSTGSLRGIVEAAQFKVGTAMLPEKEKFGCPTGGAGIGIMAAAPDERKKAAFEFIKFAAKPENVAYWAQQTGYMPVTNSGRESAEMQSYFKTNPNYKAAVEQLPKTQPQDPVRPLVPNGDQTIGKALERILANNEPAPAAFKAAAQQLKSDAEEVKQQVKDKQGASRILLGA